MRPQDPAGDAQAGPEAEVAADASGRAWWRRRRWLLLLGLVGAGALVSAGVAIGSWATDEDADRSPRSASSSPAAPGAADRNPAATRGSQQDVTATLHRLSRAVMARDKSSYLALIDPASTSFRADQARLFDRITKVPLASWTLRYEGLEHGLRDVEAARLPDGALVVRVRLAYRLRRVDSTFVRTRYLTFVPTQGRWLLAGEDQALEKGLASEPEVWDLGPIRVVRGVRSVVIGAGSRTDLRADARAADLAVTDVSQVWHLRWSRRPVVIVPRTQADMAKLVASHGGLSQIAAVTTGYVGSGPPAGNRIVVNPRYWGRLLDVQRRIVMAHEVTHLATREVTQHEVPIWLSEGFADYVAYTATGVQPVRSRSPLLEAVRGGDVPASLPDRDAFDAATADVDKAYDGAWLACRMIREMYGERRLVRLYVELADGVGGPEDEEIRTVLGITEQHLTRLWRSYLGEQAAR